jgi:hypothetical protein
MAVIPHICAKLQSIEAKQISGLHAWLVQLKAAVCEDR